MELSIILDNKKTYNMDYTPSGLEESSGRSEIGNIGNDGSIE